MPEALLQVFRRAARGEFPPGNASTTHLPSPSSPADVVCAFFGHHLIASDVDPAFVQSWTERDPFALSDVRFLAALANELGTSPGILDAVFATTGLGKSPDDLGLIEIDDRSHPRVQRALHYRDAGTLRVFADEDLSGVLLLGQGVAGRIEGAYEVDDAARGKGLGRRFIAAARALAPLDEPVFLSISPGNVWSMRALGHDSTWKPIGSEILFLRTSSSDPVCNAT
jgi:GNAT superfamily N-acetyltransferase